MKTRNAFTTFALGLLLALSFLPACSDDDSEEEQSNIVTFQNSTITGSQEVPPNTSQASGTFSGTYNKKSKILTYTITFSGVTPINMHFHKGEPGVSGPIVVGIEAAPYTSPIKSQTPALTTDQETDLLAGKWYVNIHSDQYKGGEIRGQVVK